jgi:hypothetical protein
MRTLLLELRPRPSPKPDCPICCGNWIEATSEPRRGHCRLAASGDARPFTAEVNIGSTDWSRVAEQRVQTRRSAQRLDRAGLPGRSVDLEVATTVAASIPIPRWCHPATSAWA